MNCKDCKFYRTHYFYGEWYSELQSISCELLDREIRTPNRDKIDKEIGMFQKECIISPTKARVCDQKCKYRQYRM